eukprot:m.17093 g.17093  ORF g.17093 m.17093 type:complete len:165 (-) comp11328_c0_seq1:108-602(-)
MSSTMSRLMRVGARSFVQPLRYSSSLAISNQAVVSAEVATGDVMSAPIFTGVPNRELVTRTVRITEPAIKVTQSGSYGKGGAYKMTWDTQERWENPLMGWASTADPLSNLVVDFETLEAAQSFCQKNGWSYYVYAQPKKILAAGKKKGYGANFSWDKRTRKSCK